MNSNTSFPDLMPPKLAGIYLGGEESPIPEQTLAVWRLSGRYGLPYVKIGRLVRYRKSDLDSFMKKNTVTRGCALATA